MALVVVEIAVSGGGSGRHAGPVRRGERPGAVERGRGLAGEELGLVVLQGLLDDLRDRAPGLARKLVGEVARPGAAHGKLRFCHGDVPGCGPRDRP